MGKFTGFIAYYKNGRIIKEKNFFFNNKLNRVCATNWYEIDKNQLIQLDLWWNGEKKERIKKHPDIQNWIFYHTGQSDSNGYSILSRSIGYSGPRGQYIASIDEKTGEYSVSCNIECGIL